MEKNGKNGKNGKDLDMISARHGCQVGASGTGVVNLGKA